MMSPLPMSSSRYEEIRFRRYRYSDKDTTFFCPIRVVMKLLRHICEGREDPKWRRHENVKDQKSISYLSSGE